MSESFSAPKWSRDTKFIVTVIALLVAVALIYLARNVLPLLALAAVLAYIFQPLVGWLERRGIRRGLATAICVLLLILLVALVPLLLIPAVISGVRAIVDVLDRLPQIFQQRMDLLIARQPVFGVAGITVDVASVVTETQTLIDDALADLELPGITSWIDYIIEGVRTAGGIFRTAADIATSVIAVVVSALLLLVYTFYLTKDGNQLSQWLNRLILPSYRPELRQVGHRLDHVWQSFFRGQIVLSLTIGIVTFLATAALGLPGSLVLGILAGVLEVVPTLGPVLAMIPAVLVALIQGSSYLPVTNLVFALIVVLVYVLIQQIENNFLVPRIMGESLDLHPLIVLIGVVVGASFAGILGAFLAGPVLASLKVVGWYAHAKLNDVDPLAYPVLQPPPRGRGGGPLGPVLRLLERAKARRAAGKDGSPVAPAAAPPGARDEAPVPPAHPDSEPV